jgi:hypothetical protein
MTRLVWDSSEPNQYELGVDRGVLYPETTPGVTGIGVAWNGLISVEESAIGGEVTPYYFDGIKYADYRLNTEYQAVLSAYSMPPEFAPAVGERPVVPGFILTRQHRSKFAMTYRTLINESGAYKIHLVYNATASRKRRTHSTDTTKPKVPEFSWQIDAVPPASTTYYPSAHFIVDSTKVTPAKLLTIENTLYGTSSTAPAMITIAALLV